MNLQDLAEQGNVDEQSLVPLFTANFFKAVPGENEDAPWRFRGIASDESEDVEGDAILKKSIDLTYAQARGYVNWDHSREPENQLGFLTKAVIIDKTQIEALKKDFPEISERSSIYVEGELYKHLPKAASVYAIMKSTAAAGGGLGLSIDGSIARDTRNGGIIKAFVRGVALTSQPVQTRTIVKLKKSIGAYNLLNEVGGGTPTDAIKSIVDGVLAGMDNLQKSTAPVALDHDAAVLYVLKQRPSWSYDLATKLVTFTMDKAKRS